MNRRRFPGFRWTWGGAMIAGVVLASAAAFASGTVRAGRAGRLAWWRRAKFGLFIHWGIYSVPAGEWKGGKNHAEWIMLTGRIPCREYRKFAEAFNPVGFDAREWARIAADAGMKYMVITSKHHDGFCMFDSRLTDYDIVDATPYGRDPMKPLAAACAERGIRFCFYYSIADWHHPEFPAKYSQRGFHGCPNPKADLEKYVAYMKGQVRELLTNYGPIGIMWFDGGGSFRGVDKARLIHAQEIADLIHELQPGCLINNRLGADADYGTPEQHIPGGKQSRDFEVCMTLNRHWGYNKYDHAWKQPPEVIRKLVDIVSKGGNFLLNVGPTAEGKFPEEAVRILHEVGKWLRVNGESIYGTTATPFPDLPSWGRITCGAGRLYVHIFDWPRNGRLVVGPLENEVTEVRLLRDPARPGVRAVREGGNLVLILPGEAPDPVDSVAVVSVIGDPRVPPRVVKQEKDGRLILRAATADVHGTKAHYEYDKKTGKDNIGYWVDARDWVSWLAEFARPGTYEVWIVYACPPGTAGTVFDVGVGPGRVRGVVRATGSWTAFRRFLLQRVIIPRRGRYSVTVKPVRMPGFAVMNLKAIEFVPVG